VVYYVSADVGFRARQDGQSDEQLVHCVPSVRIRMLNDDLILVDFVDARERIFQGIKINQSALDLHNIATSDRIRGDPG
jgi:hypothetical protein